MTNENNSQKQNLSCTKWHFKDPKFQNFIAEEVGPRTTVAWVVHYHFWKIVFNHPNLILSKPKKESRYNSFKTF